METDIETMTKHCRILAALTISVVAGVTAGCSSPVAAPTASAKSTPSASAPVATTPVATTPNGGKPAYCALLATAYLVKPPSGKSVTAAEARKFGKLVEPAAAAASAAGKKDVGDGLSLIAVMNSDITKLTAKQGEAAFASMPIIVPIVMKDCGIDLMK